MSSFLCNGSMFILEIPSDMDNKGHQTIILFRGLKYHREKKTRSSSNAHDEGNWEEVSIFPCLWSPIKLRSLRCE